MNKKPKDKKKSKILFV